MIKISFKCFSSNSALFYCQLLPNRAGSLGSTLACTLIHWNFFALCFFFSLPSEFALVSFVLWEQCLFIQRESTVVEFDYLYVEEGSAEGPLLSASAFGKLKAFPESNKVAVEICSWRQAKALPLI